MACMNDNIHMIPDSWPGVTMICPTYNRVSSHPHLLEECIESFVRQDYPGQKELLILNDCRGQIIECQTRGVRIVNSRYRYRSMGDKRNALVEMAKYDLICCADDDDISLPWRLSVSVGILLRGKYDYVNPKAYWFINGELPAVFEQMTGYAHNCSLYTRAAWLKSGRYPPHCRDDAEFDHRLNSHCRGWRTPLGIDQCFYIYRWGVSDHLSGNNDMDYAYNRKITVAKNRGVYNVQPQWYHDYVGAINEAKTMRVNIKELI
jgi:glycosyltransferase involved in cell wall biosynthesis